MIEPVRPQDASGIYRQQVARSAVQAADERPRAVAAGARGRRADQIHLSERARELREALAAVQAQPEARAELVAAIRREIAGGSYRLDAREIARRLMTEGRDA